MKNLNTFYRYKNNIPFSYRLNEWLEIWFNNRKEFFVFTNNDDFNSEDIEGTFKAHQKRFRDTKKIHIWNGESEKTIFGDSKFNLYFRAWHDYIHIKYGFGYSQTDEAIVSDIQKNQLPKDWIFERELIHAEIVGQAHYNYINNSFVKEQRLFTIEYLQDTVKALNNKSYGY